MTAPKDEWRGCHHCGTSFKVARHRWLNCSAECDKTAERKRRAKWMRENTPHIFDPTQERTCQNKQCEIAFTPSTPNQVYCSSACHPSAREYELRAVIRRRSEARG